MAEASHWDAVYQARDEEALTWFEASPGPSLELINEYLSQGQALVDVGAGASRLVEHLLEAGFGPVMLVDLSPHALDVTRERLGANRQDVEWQAADVTNWSPARRYALWHDRAVFHFLTGESDRARYVATMTKALGPGGIAIIATFAEDGPMTCSGLPVRRYSPADLAAEIDRLAPGRFEPLKALRHEHITPKGNVQNFQLSVFRKRAVAQDKNAP